MPCHTPVMEFYCIGRCFQEQFIMAFQQGSKYASVLLCLKLNAENYVNKGEHPSGVH